METKNTRRNFIKKSATLALGTLAASTFVNNTLHAVNFIEKENTLPTDNNTLFKIAPLPYGYDALEPHIDKQTMEIHYLKHHQGYVNNLNKALEGIDKNALSELHTLNNIFDKMAKLPIAVRNNAGGHYNHSLFWTLMAPPKEQSTNPTGKLAEAINTTFGSLDELKKQFNDAATKRFGSGWAWLVVSNGKLTITSTANQDNPLMNIESIELKGTPILALDVWEHAYYLKHQNRRADYIASWWKVINWETAEKLFAEAK